MYPCPMAVTPASKKDANNQTPHVMAWSIYQLAAQTYDEGGTLSYPTKLLSLRKGEKLHWHSEAVGASACSNQLPIREVDRNRTWCPLILHIMSPLPNIHPASQMQHLQSHAPSIVQGRPTLPFVSQGLSRAFIPPFNQSQCSETPEVLSSAT